MARLAVSSKTEALQPVQLVTFEVDGGSYGLDIRVVKEINPAVHLTAVPWRRRTFVGW